MAPHQALVAACLLPTTVKAAKEVEIDVDDLTIGPRVYAADNDKWWYEQGLKILGRVR